MLQIINQIYFLDAEQQIGWIQIGERMKSKLKNIWKGNLHSLTFESGIEGYFFVDNVCFHFTINPNHIAYSMAGVNGNSQLVEQFKQTFDLLFALSKKQIARVAPPGHFRVISVTTMHDSNKEEELIGDYPKLEEAFTQCTTNNCGNSLLCTYFCFDDKGNQPGRH